MLVELDRLREKRPRRASQLRPPCSAVLRLRDLYTRSTFSHCVARQCELREMLESAERSHCEARCSAALPARSLLSASIALLSSRRAAENLESAIQPSRELRLLPQSEEMARKKGEGERRARTDLAGSSQRTHALVSTDRPRTRVCNCRSTFEEDESRVERARRRVEWRARALALLSRLSSPLPRVLWARCAALDARAESARHNGDLLKRARAEERGEEARESATECVRRASGKRHFPLSMLVSFGSASQQVHQWSHDSRRCRCLAQSCLHGRAGSVATTTS